MGPLTLRVYRGLQVSKHPDRETHLRIVQDAAHFMIPSPFFEKCRDIAECFPVEEYPAKMPADNVFVEVESDADGPGVGFMLGPDTTLPGVVAMTIFDERNVTGIGHWRPRTKLVGLTQEIRDQYPNYTEAEVQETQDFKKAILFAQTLATLLELICEPRLVEQVRMPRADRKRAAREMGAVGLPTTWARVRWNIGEKTISKNQGSDEAHSRPYHMVRGHWRNYGDRHTASSERRTGRPGWWVWIDTHHAGNPAFGIVGHRYEPKLHPERSALVVRNLIASRTLYY